MKEGKILIVEDEQIIAENLRLILNEYGYNNVDVAIDDQETIDLFNQTPYDLVLMDINLGDFSSVDGIDLIKQLSKTYNFVFMYVTANADEKTIDKAKETTPLGYIIKPFINTSIYANVEMALNRIKKEEIFTYSNQGMQYQILLSDIMYLEADGAYIIIYTSDNQSHFVRKSLSEFTELYTLPFIRIHKSYIVHKSHVQAHSSQFVKVNDMKLPLGRAYKTSFLQKVKSTPFAQ